MYRLSWWLLLALALTAVTNSWFDPASAPAILAVRLAKSAVLLAVSAILFRRRGRDPVAAMLALAFLLWIASSSIDISSAAMLPAILDRFRFLLFAAALLLFPDGQWRPGWTPAVALAIAATFLLGIAEAIGLLNSTFYLPIATACVVAALVALIAKYRALEDGTERQQLKWVNLGLFAGISLILSARALAALTADMAMPLIGTAAIEGLFQLGIIVLSLGFLISLLRYRLYDAEAAISRSAAYAGLTLALVGTFAASEAIIQTLGQRYFGSGIGDLSAAIAAAIAAVLLTPLHSRISNWAEQHFQHDLAAFKRDLPDLLMALSAGTSVKRLAAAVLPPIEQAVQSTRIALLVDGRIAAAQGIELTAARKLLAAWQPAAAEPIGRNDEDAFPLQMALRCPLGSIRGWLLLGPRPDGSFYGKDDLEALAEIGPALQRTLVLVAEREHELARQRRIIKNLDRSMALFSIRLERVERL